MNCLKLSDNANRSTILDDFQSKFEKRLNRIEQEMKIKNCLSSCENAMLYSSLHDDIHNLRVMLTKMKIVIENMQKDLETFKVSIYFCVQKNQTYDKVILVVIKCKLIVGPINR